MAEEEEDVGLDEDMRAEGEEDARSEASFQSADDDDDFDLPQDFGPAVGSSQDPSGAAADADEDEGGGGAMPPGLDDVGADDAGAERWNLRKDGNKEQLEPIFVKLSADREHVKISKMFSYVLRHAAHKLDVRIRKDGYSRLREIMKLRNFKPYTLEELMAVVYFDEKERYTMVREFDGELLIRANQGHTMKVVESEMLLDTITDPTTVADCVHGTYLVHWPFIKRQGLSKVARNHIHMANGLPEDGKIRGMRSTAELFVYVDVPKAMEEGIVFYRSKNDVILTHGLDGWIPPRYFQKAVRIDYNTCDIDELEFDVDAAAPQWASELAPSGPGEQGTYQIKNLESLISTCRKRLQEINELKALLEAGTQDLTDEEKEKIENHAPVYSELQSLEQRFRQHKGYRRESGHEKEARAKEEAEAGTVIKRKDRAVTPPWERNKPELESNAMKSTEKEKAEWAALGKRRDDAPEKTPTAKKEKKEDPWDVLGRGRLETGSAAPTPSNRAAAGRGRDDDDDNWRRKEPVDRTPVGRKQSGNLDDDDKGNWRFGRSDSKDAPTRKDSRAGDSTPSGKDGPPRFINSKKAEGGSWRDRMTMGKDDKDDKEDRRPQQPPTPSQTPKPSDSGPSWRDQMRGKPAHLDEVTDSNSGPSWRDQMRGGSRQLDDEKLPPPPAHVPSVPNTPAQYGNTPAGGNMMGATPGAMQGMGTPAANMMGTPAGNMIGSASTPGGAGMGQYDQSMMQWQQGTPMGNGGQGGGQMMNYGGQQYYCPPATPGAEQGGMAQQNWMGQMPQQYPNAATPSGDQSGNNWMAQMPQQYQTSAPMSNQAATFTPGAAQAPMQQSSMGGCGTAPFTPGTAPAMQQPNMGGCGGRSLYIGGDDRGMGVQQQQFQMQQQQRQQMQMQQPTTPQGQQMPSQGQPSHMQQQMQPQQQAQQPMSQQSMPRQQMSGQPVRSPPPPPPEDQSQQQRPPMQRNPPQQQQQQSYQQKGGAGNSDSYGYDGYAGGPAAGGGRGGGKGKGKHDDWGGGGYDDWQQDSWGKGYDGGGYDDWNAGYDDWSGGWEGGYGASGPSGGKGLKGAGGGGKAGGKGGSRGGGAFEKGGGRGGGDKGSGDKGGGKGASSGGRGGGRGGGKGGKDRGGGDDDDWAALGRMRAAA